MKDTKELVAKRQDANREILSVLSALVEKYPDIRFNQLMQSAGVNVLNSAGYAVDLFYEESVVTRDRVVEKVAEF